MRLDFQTRFTEIPLLTLLQSRVKGCWPPTEKSRWGPLISASI